MMSIRPGYIIRFFSRAAAAAAVVAAALLLFTCGELSMYEMLDAEEPGALAMSQSELNLPPEAEYRLMASGGFKPYLFQFEPTPGAGTLDNDALYRAPLASETPAEDKILVTDRFGSTAAATVRVFAPLRASPTSITAVVGQNAQDVSISGGNGERTLYNHGTKGNAYWDNPDNKTTVKYSPPGATEIGDGRDSFSIEDEFGSTVEVTVTLHLAESLRLDPATATILTNDSLTIELQGTFNSVSYEISDPFFAHAHIDDALLVSDRQLVFSPVETVGTAVITVTDDDDPDRSAGATIHVVEQDPGDIEELTISPNSGTFTDGTTVEFSASGGVAPYTFERVGPGSGQPVAVGENKARYTVSFPPGVAQIRLTDHTGEHVTAKLNVSK